jgi:hypothetical protein
MWPLAVVGGEPGAVRLGLGCQVHSDGLQGVGVGGGRASIRGHNTLMSVLEHVGGGERKEHCQKEAPPADTGR